MTDSIAPPSILIVDDSPRNLSLLGGMLTQRGYCVRPFLSGPAALEAASEDPPDMVLLDINMPDMDGYEVCARMKGTEELKDIPVIFISALNDAMDKVRAFKAGAVDYISKPFQLREVEARVMTHLELRRQQRELEASNEKLRGLEALRDALLHMIVHNIRGPLTTISLSAEMLAKLADHGFSEQASLLVRRTRDSSWQLMEMVESMLDLSRLEAGEASSGFREVDVVELARSVVDRVAILAGERTILLESRESAVRVVANPRLLARVLKELLDRAIAATPVQGTIRVVIAASRGVARVEVRDEGTRQGCDGALESSQGGSGDNSAPPTFFDRAIEAHGGTMGVHVAPDGGGCVSWFIVPTRCSPHQATKPWEVLVIDQDSAARRDLERHLTRAGFTAVTADTGTSGCAYAQAHLPDAVLLEVNLPDMDGGEVAFRLESDPRTRSIPVILVTDLVQEGDMDDSQMVGRWNCIAKPVRPERLSALLWRLLQHN